MTIRTADDLLTFAAEHGICQSELAQALGVGQPTITEAKQGKRWKRGIPERLHERLDAWAEQVAGLGACATDDINLNHDDDSVACADTADPAKRARQRDPSQNTGPTGDPDESAGDEDRQDIQPDTFELLDAAPERISRPLGLVGGNAYAVTWIHTRRTIHRDKDGNKLETPRQVTAKVRVVIDGKGQMYASAPVPGCTGPSKLGLDVTCDDPVPDRSAWSGKGVLRYREGERSSPAKVFSDLKAVVGHFMSFEYSFAPQEQMEELIACEVIGTYMLQAFNLKRAVEPLGRRNSRADAVHRT